MAGDGSKRARVIELLARGDLTHTQIAERVPCARSYVVEIHKDPRVTLEPPPGRRDRVEQAIARGLDDAAVARECGESLTYVARIRAAMDRAVA